MKAGDLHFDEVLSFDPQGGVIRFGGARVILLDSTAVGLFRRELIEGLGWSGARMVLTRFGFAQGWRTAENLRHDFPWDSETDRKSTRLNSSHGYISYAVFCLKKKKKKKRGTTS